MNRLIAISIALFFCYTQLSAQKTNFGISLNFLNDYNWNKPFQDIQHPSLLPNVNIQSRFPVNFGFLFERRYIHLSQSVGINFIQRNLAYSQNYTNFVTFSHQTLEVPLNFTYRKHMGNDASLITNIGGGLSYILTPTNKTQTGLKSNDTIVYEFSLINPNKINGFIDVGIGIENKINDMGILQVKFQYVYHLVTGPKYTVFSSGFIQTTNPFRNNYAMVGLTLYPQFCKTQN